MLWILRCCLLMMTSPCIEAATLGWVNVFTRGHWKAFLDIAVELEVPYISAVHRSESECKWLSVFTWLCKEPPASPGCDALTLTEDRVDCYSPLWASVRRKWKDASRGCAATIFFFKIVFCHLVDRKAHWRIFSSHSAVSCVLLSPSPHKGLTGGSRMHQFSFLPTGST